VFNLKLIISEQAANWYETEMELHRGDSLQFFIRYGGYSNVKAGLSLGIQKNEPQNAGVSTTINEITYFIEEDDLWYFDDFDLHVQYNSKQNEPEFVLMKNQA